MPRNVVEVRNLVKQYNGFVAVNDLSFDVFDGDVFGLLGPNGAGKTSTIRIIMDIFKADSGKIQILSQPPGIARERIGYLPEERGLYRNLKVQTVLVYLARLKGMTSDLAGQRASQLLERVGLSAWANRKVKDLSRGMQQKLQFAASLVHDPNLVVMDEPFQGLDPVNIELIRSMIQELHEEGKTIVLSSHQLNMVEALCDRIVLINRGRSVLYGELDEIKRRYAPRMVRVRTSADIDSLSDVAAITRHGTDLSFTLDDGMTPQELLRILVERNVPVDLFEVASVPLEEIFITVVKEDSSE
jgi:ABC-2 type transport system ATP-binding protein